MRCYGTVEVCYVGCLVLRTRRHEMILEKWLLCLVLEFRRRYKENIIFFSERIEKINDVPFTGRRPPAL